MVPILSFEKPVKIMSKKKWMGISADCAPPGVYISNMSREDKLKWKAKKIGGKDPRIEIRKTAIGELSDSRKDRYNAQVVLIVRSDTVIFSSNGKALMNTDELLKVIKEARKALKT